MIWELISWSLLPLVILIFLFIKNKSKFCFGLTAAAITNLFIKYLFLVPREIGLGPAFPSFHAQIAWFIAYFAHKKMKHGWILFILAFLISISRVFRGMHTELQILAGAVLGILVAEYFLNKPLRVNWRELGRQSIHFLAILFIPINFYFGLTSVWLSIAVAIGILLLSQIRFFSYFKRKTEKSFLDASLYFAIIAFILFFFPFRISSAAIAALAIGDALATIYGKHYKLGSLAMLMTSYVGMYFFVGREIALATALVITVAEKFMRKDNIVIPALVIIMLTLFGV